MPHKTQPDRTIRHVAKTLIHHHNIYQALKDITELISWNCNKLAQSLGRLFLFTLMTFRFGKAIIR